MKNLYIGLCALTLTIFLIPSLSGQQSKLRKAQHYVEVLQYDKAIEIYNRIYRKNPTSQEALYGLSKSYQKSGHLEAAKDWYVQAIGQSDLPPYFYYNYGQTLLHIGDCEGAQLQFTEFLRRKPYDARRVELEDVCTYWETISNPEGILVSIDNPSFNSVGSDLAPSFFNKSLVFGSVRQLDGQKHSSYDLYSVHPKMNPNELDQQFEYGAVNSFSSTLNSKLNEAIITFNHDYTEAYFTRNKTEAIGEKYPLRRLEILVSQKNGQGTWSTPVALPFNSPHYSTAHPALSPDGNRLFFTSDRPGGFGGKDIYVSNREEDNWSMPANLGPIVNTKGDELYPFFHKNGELYFASDGQLGLGGQDIFKAIELDGGTWGDIINLGFPLNSEWDDFGLILSQEGTYGFFTSNRDGGKGGDDIYAFRAKRVLLELNLMDSQGEPIFHEVSLMDGKDQTLIISNEEGKVALWLNKNECRNYTIVDENYYPFIVDICDTTSNEEDKIVFNWALQKKESTNEIIQSEMNGEAILYGTIYDKLSGDVLAGAEIQLKGIDCEKSITLVSDKNGVFSYHWDDIDCCVNVLVSKDGFFSENIAPAFCENEDKSGHQILVNLAPYRLSSKHEALLAGNELRPDPNVGTLVYDDGYSAIPYKLNIFYDLGRASVRKEGLAELNKLRKIMENNPTLLVEVCSHTDTRGSSAYNWKLSQRRANAIVNYLIKRGISSDRLIARGYGEERLANDCNGSTECSEEDHQKNRRTEFRVLEHRYGQSN